ncbi:MAG: putative abortive infection protein [Candidatus Rifleibacterium amylolyticum]|nr:MAG: putative abortive infection protein [Candidatus Rifleibacterium amylolyticum]
MLVQFTFDNFRSIKDQVTFSMVSGLNNRHSVIKARNYSLLPSAVIYGANASGKSNVVRALDYMKAMVLNVRKVFQSTDTLNHEPFRLSTETMNASSSFEVIFLNNQVKYRYGFEADSTTVYSEWLFADEKGKEARLFFRDSDTGEFYVNPEKFKEGKGLKVLSNSLFIWKCDQEGGQVARSILEWFKKVNLLNGMRPSDYLLYTLNQMKKPEFYEEIKRLVTSADFGIDDLKHREDRVPVNEIDNLPVPKEIRDTMLANASPLVKLGARTIHVKYDEAGAPVGFEEFDLAGDESEGTKKYFCLSAPFIDTLRNGKILLVDELDASLHPLLTMALISLFNNPDINTRNAQLIFVSHDTNLLNQKLFHKSQIWFTEKDRFGSTHLHSLVDYKNVRATDNLEKHYIQGKYGAIPYVGRFPGGK